MEFTNSNIILAVIVIILFYFIGQFILFETKREFIIGISKVVQGFAVGFLLVGYLESKNKEKQDEIKRKEEEYIRYVSDTVEEIEQLFLDNPKELTNLWYEFYGYDKFPNKIGINEKEINNSDITSEITQIEYVTLLKIIQKLYVIFIVDSNIYDDIYFINRVWHYIKRSNKCKYVFSVTREIYSIEFYKKLLSTGLLVEDEQDVIDVTIPNPTKSYVVENSKKCNHIY
jgi:hypothetical protein